MTERNSISKSQIDGSNVVFGNQENQYFFLETPDIIEDLGVINDIFRYILDNKLAGKERSRDFIDVNKKIIINFLDNVTQVNEFMKKAYEKLNLIEEIFSRMDSYEQDDVHLDIFFRYEELKRQGIDNYSIIFELTKQYLPSGKERNPRYRSISLALVLFFFEDCTWGEKTPKELSQLS